MRRPVVLAPLRPALAVSERAEQATALLLRWRRLPLQWPEQLVLVVLVLERGELQVLEPGLQSGGKLEILGTERSFELGCHFRDQEGAAAALPMLHQVD